ncbi:hypothetical protein GCM10023214_72340 [Amycolatopsis dongchuanensis]|uniref:Uncharacterized protein n=1 Tax=Amycolatopsis dongchuanensis TaxID=1070866 RepID=A0ABP8VNN8_9PSEU
MQALADTLHRVRPDRSPEQWARWIEKQITDGRAPQVPAKLTRRVVEYYFRLSLLLRSGRTAAGALGVLACLGFTELIKPDTLRSDLRKLCSGYGLPVNEHTARIPDDELTEHAKREAARVIKRASDKPEVRERVNALRQAARSTPSLQDNPHEVIHNLVSGAITFSEGGDLYGADDLSDMMPYLTGTEPLSPEELRSIKSLTPDSISRILNIVDLEKIISTAQLLIPKAMAQEHAQRWDYASPHAIKAAIVDAVLTLATFGPESDKLNDILNEHRRFNDDLNNVLRSGKTPQFE